MVSQRVDVFDTAAGPIEAAVAGSGPCVLVIHGTPGSWRQTFSLEQDIRDAFTVVSPSRPGFGRTPVSTGRTPSEQARAYAALLDALGIERALVVGASGGGPSSIAFAREHAARTDGLVLVCAMAIEMIEVPTPLLWTARPVIGEVLSALARVVARRRLHSDGAADRWMQKELTPDEIARVRTDPRVRADLIAFAKTHLDAPPGLPGIRNDLVQVRAAQARGWHLDGITAPTLIMHGSSDVVVPLSHAEHHARAIPGGRLEVYDDAGHVFLMTRRTEVNTSVRAFLGEHAGSVR